MGTIHDFPGNSAGPAMRVISGHLASEEQQRAARECLGLTYPEDLIWQSPGEPVRSAEVVEVPRPAQYRLALSDRLKQAIWSGAVGAYGLACAVAGGVLVAIVAGWM